MAEISQFLFDNLWSAGVGFIILAMIFSPLEWILPARPGQKFLRPEWFTDLSFFLGQYLLWGGLTVELLGILQSTLGGLLFGAQVAQLPIVLQLVCAVLLGDLCIYWVHRLQHSWDLLWRFHSVHHTAEHLDWLAAHREHPIDGLITQTAINLPALLLGISLNAITWLILFRGLWAIYIHANVRLPIGPLRVLIGSPEIHHWHHARDSTPCNFANLSPLMDVLFGTYVCKDHEPEAYGIQEIHPRSYLGQLFHALTRPSRDFHRG
jgi:sterol desaturase/sphingolipid hydroxylase (fatty acid hydroxylase superfamily)